jgi:predicted transcriptional regulator
VETQLPKLVARDIMTTEVLLAQADWTIHELTAFLVTNSISGAPVVGEDGTVVGVVSLTDLARSLVPELGIPDGECLPDAPRTVRDIMTPLMFEVHEEAPVLVVAETMVRRRMHRLFVTRERKVIGIIAAIDLLRVMGDL